MLHDLWQTYDLNDATLQILTMLTVAFLLGLLLGYIIWGRRISLLMAENKKLINQLDKAYADASTSTSGESSVEALNLCREEKEKLQANLTSLEAKLRSLEGGAKNIKTEASTLATGLMDSAAAAPPKKKDNLKRVEGIGPKIESILNDNGVYTFEKLSKTDPEQIRKWLLAVHEKRYRIHDPSTWPEQAGIAASGDWAKLAKWQDELKGGKKV